MEWIFLIVMILFFLAFGIGSYLYSHSEDKKLKELINYFTIKHIESGKELFIWGNDGLMSHLSDKDRKFWFDKKYNLLSDEEKNNYWYELYSFLINISMRDLYTLVNSCEEDSPSILHKYSVDSLSACIRDCSFLFLKIKEKSNIYKINDLANDFKESYMEVLHQVIFAAIRENEYDLVKFIIQDGMDLQIKNSDGYTPLLWAKQCGRLNIVSLIEEIAR